MHFVRVCECVISVGQKQNKEEEKTKISKIFKFCQKRDKNHKTFLFSQKMDNVDHTDSDYFGL